MQNSLVFRDGYLKIVWNLRLVCTESIGIVNLLIVKVHFHIWYYWMHYVVYIGNSSYFFFFVIFYFRENNRLIFVLLFFTLVFIATTSFDNFELQCQKRLSQINLIVPICLKLKLLAVFNKWGSWIHFFFLRRQDIVNNWTFPPSFLDTATKSWYRKFLFDKINEKCL